MITQVFKRILLIINVIFAVALMASIADGLLSPAYLSVLVLFGLAFPYFLILNIAFIIFWGVLRHRFFLISTLAVLASSPIIIDTFQFLPKRSNQGLSNTFNVMSYNVRVFDLYNWTNNKISRNKIFQLIRDEGIDIACFQEYFNNTKSYFPVHDSLMANQRFRYSHLYLNINLTNGHQFGIATYSSFPIINKKELLFKDTHNLVILSDIKIDDDTLRVINCHLQSVRFLVEDYHFIDSLPIMPEKAKMKSFLGVFKRLISAAEKRALQADLLLKEIEKSPYPVLICGDFNDTPYSYTYQKLTRLLNDSHEYHKIGIGGTYNQFFTPLRIDYILFEPGINCVEFKTIKSNLSDHYPIVGKYSIH